MNIYEISCNGWLARVKAGSMQTAISRGLGVLSKDAGINSVHTKNVHVSAKVLARGVSRDAKIPPFEEPRPTSGAAELAAPSNPANRRKTPRR